MIEKIAHTTGGLNKAQSFYDNVITNVSMFQSEGLEVEIQYGQSDNLFSALIIGRKPKNNNQNVTLNIESFNANNIDEATKEITEKLQNYASSR